MRTESKVNLIYEEMDGHSIMYKNFHKVLLSQASIEDIMDSSVSQSLVVAAILRFLFVHLDQKKYWIATNEPGFHLSKGNNLSADIAIMDRTIAKPDPKQFNYQTDPPTVVFEVDIKADMSDFPTPLDYYRRKADKFRQFSVGKVIWVNTDTETIMFDAELNPIPWNTPIRIGTQPELVMNVGELVRAYCQ
jgi:Uma2 family endonuclease